MRVQKAVKPDVRRISRYPYLIALGLAMLMGSYLALTGSSIGVLTVQYDEFTDLLIASSLSKSPLVGNTYDADQARLPMYITAVAYRIFQGVKPNAEPLDVLPISRWISVFATVLAILATFVLGYRLFNVATGLLAAMLFSFSTYTLEFGRDALTQGDALTPLPVVLALLAFERFETKRTTLWLFCFSFCLALAVNSKFFLVILIPALILYQLLQALIKRYYCPHMLADDSQDRHATRVSPGYIHLAVTTGALALLALISRWLGLKTDSFFMSHRLAPALWLTTLLGLLLSFVGSLDIVVGRGKAPTRSQVRWRLDGAWLVILPLVGAATLALCPAHTFNTAIVLALFQRSVNWDGLTFWAETLNSIKLYFGILLFKLGLPFGVATCIALIWAVVKAYEHQWLRMITAILLCYGMLLIMLPLQQPFWLMSVYPLILLILAAMIVDVITHVKPLAFRIGLTCIVALSFGWLAIGVLRVYPMFGYYGYEWVGNRWLGINSRGYRAVVVVTNDGSTEAIDWLRENVPAGSFVLSYLNDIHLIKYLDRLYGLPFELKHALHESNPDVLTQALTRADYVVVRCIDDLRIALPVENPIFIQHFGTKPVYQLVRGQGKYQMPVIQIFQHL